MSYTEDKRRVTWLCDLRSFILGWLAKRERAAETGCWRDHVTSMSRKLKEGGKVKD